jgi:hypothetical protein
MKLQHTLSIQKDGKTISGKIIGVEWGDFERGEIRKIWNKKKDFYISSWGFPAIDICSLFVWGDDKKRDNETISYTFESKERAKEVLDFINEHSVVNKLAKKKKKVVKKKVWKAGDFYPEWEKLTPFPKDKTAKELGLKVGDLVVDTTNNEKFQGEISKVVAISSDFSRIKIDEISWWCDIDCFSPLPGKPTKKPKLQKIQSAVWEYEDVRMEEGKIIFSDGEFTPDSLADFLRKGRRIMAQYNKIKF